MDRFEKWDKENGLIPEDMLYYDTEGNSFTQSEIDEMIRRNESFVAEKIDMEAISRWKELKKALETLVGKEDYAINLETTEPNPRNPFVHVFFDCTAEGEMFTKSGEANAFFYAYSLCDEFTWAKTEEGVRFSFCIRVYS